MTKEKHSNEQNITAYVRKNFKGLGLIVGFTVIVALVIIALQTYFTVGLMQKVGVGNQAVKPIAMAAAFFILVIGAGIVFLKKSFKVGMYLENKVNGVSTEVSDMMQKISDGDLHTEFKYLDQDEFTNMFANTQQTVKQLDAYVRNISAVLHYLSLKNMDVNVEINYKGDFAPIKKSLEEIIDSLNTMFHEFNEAIEGIAEGADNVSKTAQSIAEGATTQSTEVKNLVDNINTVTEDVSSNAENAERVSKVSLESLKQVQESNQYMDELLEAMTKIKEQSMEISNIIQVIDGIAEQTNLLSLNASIEAARAGEQGKGFAVVADEIGQLANQCGEAAKTTTDLINKSLQAVERGSELADHTAEYLGNIVTSSTDTADYVGKISAACKQQEDQLHVILDHVKKIEEVVDGNAAASQESTAISEELAAYSERLLQKIDEYKLK
ncbi:methyl-accepting chemotaxis sensory transducer [Lachnospiraceae bacterium KM106-2]|nr:methyl-accepting chemotaxis sensory transducer [Lachnospiraceae bacterium KM106-2]